MEPDNPPFPMSGNSQIKPRYRAVPYGAPGALLQPASPEEISRGRCVAIYGEVPDDVITTIVPPPVGALAPNGLLLVGTSPQPVCVEFSSRWCAEFRVNPDGNPPPSAPAFSTGPPERITAFIQVGDSHTRVIVRSGRFSYEACVCPTSMFRDWCTKRFFSLPQAR